jgi:hypothetical protein
VDEVNNLFHQLAVLRGGNVDRFVSKIPRDNFGAWRSCQTTNIVVLSGAIGNQNVGAECFGSATLAKLAAMGSMSETKQRAFLFIVVVDSLPSIQQLSEHFNWKIGSRLDHHTDSA